MGATTIDRIGFNEAGLEALLQQRGEPAWLVDQRRAAWQAFQQLAWPDRRHEEWMRTDIRLLKLDRYSLLPDAQGPSAEAQAGVRARLAEGVQTAGDVTSWNSRPLASRLDEKWRARGVVFGSLEQLVHEHPDLVRRYLFQQAVDPAYDRFAALHAAFWSGGQLLYVPRGVVVDEPLHALTVLDDGAADLSHTLVVLDEGAEATFVTETASVQHQADGFHCGATELILAPGAVLRFVHLQDWGNRAWHFAHQKAVVGRDASLQWTLAALGSRLAKVNQHVGLVGPGANSQVNGVLFTEGKQHISYHTLQHHEAPETRSDFLYKTALQDQSRTVWRGMIKVDARAQRTDGYQRNDNLMLSSEARADSIPGLEIEADDVRCTHGSTTGRVDEEQIFYAQCRGYTPTEATRLVVTGFFQQIFDRITIESVRDALAAAIARRVREYA